MVTGIGLPGDFGQVDDDPIGIGQDENLELDGFGEVEHESGRRRLLAGAYSGDRRHGMGRSRG